MKSPQQIVKDHPAETTGGVATAASMLIARAVGVDDADTIAYIAIIVAFVPAGVTWLVELVRG